MGIEVQMKRSSHLKKNSLTPSLFRRKYFQYNRWEKKESISQNASLGESKCERWHLLLKVEVNRATVNREARSSGFESSSATFRCKLIELIFWLTVPKLIIAFNLLALHATSEWTFPLRGLPTAFIHSFQAVGQWFSEKARQHYDIAGNLLRFPRPSKISLSLKHSVP